MTTSILSAVLALAGLGMVLSLVLGLAAKVFYVYVDPRIESILDILPGANCGGCGYAGCSDYAEAIVNHNVSPSLCVAAGAEVTHGVCGIMGMSADIGERNVARVFCQGSDEKAVRRFEYSGAQDCRAAIAATGGDKACEYGCVGLATCVKACPFDAMHMSPDGLPVVDEVLCTGCGTCVTICPRNLPKLVPLSQKTANLCSSQAGGKEVKAVCSVGCIACKMCVKKCPVEAVSMDGKLAVVDGNKCTGHGVCIEKCPTGSMRFLHEPAEAAEVPAEEPEQESASASAE